MRTAAALAILAASFVPSALHPGAPQDAAKPPGLESIAWLAGHWRQESDKRVVEELWLPPRGGLMIGINRTVHASGKFQFEYLRIVADEQGVVYLASPGGTKPTPFRLTKAEKALAVFENPKHDFPKRIEYRLDGEKLTASIAGDKPGPSWTFQRVATLQ